MRRSRGIERYSSRSVPMAIEVSSKEKADISARRCLAESERASFGSARQGELNGIGLEVSICL